MGDALHQGQMKFMSNKITRPLEIIETEINFYKQQTATGIIEIGKRLIEAKAQLEHGQWGKWLEEKVDFSQDTANRFMKVASEFSNSATLRNLTQSKLFALLSIPSDDRDSFLTTPHSTLSGEEKTVEEMTTREVEKAVKEWKKKVEDKDDLKEESIDIWTIVDKEYDDNTYEIPIADLKPFPDHDKYFWNMIGKNYVDFLTSIEENGVISPITITRSNMIISGHQRVRACKDLGINTIPARYLHYVNPQNRNLNDLLLSTFISLNMHTRTAVFWLACAWHDLYFGDGDKVDNYIQKFMEHDDKKLDEWLNKVRD